MADLQAALLRVAGLVARGRHEDEIFAAATQEATRIVGETTLVRFDASGRNSVVARGGVDPDPASGGGRTVRVPVMVGQRPWGELLTTTSERAGPTGAEECLQEFGVLVAAAVANAEARVRVEELVAEQAALLRVARLVGAAAGPEVVFEAVTAEAAVLMGGRPVTLVRFEGDHQILVLAAEGGPAQVGTALVVEPDTHPDRVRRRGRIDRVDDYALERDVLLAAHYGLRATVSAPVSVAGRVWGMLTVTSQAEPLPTGTEDRLDQFAQLVGAAIANAENRAQLTSSRARIVATADETRRRLQRDVHDGAQQRLVHTIISLKLAREAVRAGHPPGDLLDEALLNAEGANRELRDIVHGILPATLTRGGLRVAVASLVADLPTPVDVRVHAPRLPAPVETTAYFIVAEALTNVVKHAHATDTTVDVDVDVDGGTLVVEVHDDGVGGADPGGGSGLTGLFDRVEASSGTLRVTSEPHQGTTVRATLPLDLPALDAFAT